MKSVVPGSAFSVYHGPSHPASSDPSAVKYQTQARPTITLTTTRLITVSWNIAYGKNGFPSRSTSSLYRLCSARRSSIRRLATGAASATAGTDEPLAASRRCRRLGALAARGVGRPGRRGDAETDDEVEVQADQAEDQRREHEHVQGVEHAQRVGADLGTSR